QLLPAASAIARDEDAAASKRQSSAADLFAEVAFAGPGKHDVRLSGIDRQRVHREVGQPFRDWPPSLAVIVASPDTARHAGGKERRVSRRMVSDDAGATADVAGAQIRPGVENVAGLIRR